MTREAIEYFKFNRKIFCEDHLKICPKDSIAYQATLKEKEFYDMAIKALEQESVLDKIRAEILARDSVIKAIRSDDCCFFTAEEILELIDKAESEE